MEKLFVSSTKKCRRSLFIWLQLRYERYRYLPNSELLQWWSEFREDFSSEKLYKTIIWNNKDIRVNEKPIFYKTFFNSGVILVSDLRIDLNITESYNIIAKKIEKTNFLIWAGFRLAIPPYLKLNLRANDHNVLTMLPSLIIRNDDFNT